MASYRRRAGTGGGGNPFRSSTGNFVLPDDDYEPPRFGRDRLDPERSAPRGERFERERFERREEIDRPRFGGGRGSRYEEDDVEIDRRRTIYDDSPPRREGRRPSQYDDDYDNSPPRYAPERETRYRRQSIAFDEPPERRFGRGPAPWEREAPPIGTVARYNPPRIRPGMPLRRQSSLDDSRRRPLGASGELDYYRPERERGEYRAPPYVDIPLPRMNRSPPRRYEEDEFDEVRVFDERRRRGPGSVAEFRERKYRREGRSKDSKSRASTVTSRSSSSSSSSSGESEDPLAPKPGKTRMPRKLVSKKAVQEFGFPYEEEVCTLALVNITNADCQ
jgi:hypothetical protein